MTKTNRGPVSMSQAELDEYLDQLVRLGLEDSPEFEAAYAEWERREGD